MSLLHGYISLLFRKLRSGSRCRVVRIVRIVRIVRAVRTVRTVRTVPGVGARCGRELDRPLAWPWRGSISWRFGVPEDLETRGGLSVSGACAFEFLWSDFSSRPLRLRKLVLSLAQLIVLLQKRAFDVERQVMESDLVDPIVRLGNGVHFGCGEPRSCKMCQFVEAVEIAPNPIERLKRLDWCVSSEVFRA